MDRMEMMQAEQSLRKQADDMRDQIHQLDEEAGYCQFLSGVNAQSPSQVGPLQIRNQELEAIFTYHNNPEATPHYVEIRESAKTFARIIERHAPSCADRTSAIRAVRQAVMWANAAIALNGLV